MEKKDSFSIFWSPFGDNLAIFCLSYNIFNLSYDISCKFDASLKFSFRIIFFLFDFAIKHIDTMSVDIIIFFKFPYITYALQYESHAMRGNE